MAGGRFGRPEELMAAILFAGEVSRLYAVGFRAPAGALAAAAAGAGGFALRAMRGSP